MSEKAHWENVYNEKSAQEVSWYQPLPAVSLQMIENAGIGKTLPLLDVGGGAFTLADGLLAKGYADISGTALAVARTRLGNRASDMHWIEAGITRFQPVRRYALWQIAPCFTS